jgi:hypothetical protein
MVAMAICGYVLIAKATPGATADTVSRLVQGLVTGIGFIGGAMIKERTKVTGIVTGRKRLEHGGGRIRVYGNSNCFEFNEFFTRLSLTPIVRRNKQLCGATESENMETK